VALISLFYHSFQQELKQRCFEQAAEKFLGRPLRPNEDYITIENALREIQKNLTQIFDFIKKRVHKRVQRTLLPEVRVQIFYVGQTMQISFSILFDNIGSSRNKRSLRQRKKLLPKSL